MLQSKAMRRSGARLALFAVAVLLTLSFGHMHPEDFFPPTAQAAAHEPGAPANPAPLPPTHDDCAICVTMGMTASSAMPAPIVVALPLAYTFVTFTPPARATLAAAPKPSFRSRGPPLAI
jgi:hypothetical protein